MVDQDLGRWQVAEEHAAVYYELFEANRVSNLAVFAVTR